jgi:hypothetical protein
MLKYLPDHIWEDDAYREMILVFNRSSHLHSVFEHHSVARGKEEFRKLWKQREYMNTNTEYYYRIVQISGCDDFRTEHKRFIVGQLRNLLECWGGYLSDADCSQIIYYNTIGQYFYNGDKKWYHFINENSPHRKGQLYKWVESTTPPANLGTDIICDEFRRYFKYIRTQLDQEETDKAVCKLKSNINKTALNLGNNSRIASITKLLTQRYTQIDIDSRMNQDGFIIGVHNGILDLGFREGVKPAGYIAQPVLHKGYTPYYVTKTASSNFNQEMYDSMADGIENSTHPTVQLVYSIYSGIIVEPDALLKIMCMTSTVLDNVLSVIHILQVVAGGSNGKSVFIDNIVKAVGMEYMTKLSTNILTDKTRGGAADPDFMKIVGKRGGVITETDSGERLRASRLKQLGEHDKQGRNLFENDIDFHTNITIMLFTNYALNIEETDEGTWRRMMIYRCKMRFMENPELANESKVNREYEHIAATRPEVADAIFTMLVYYRMMLYNKFNDNLNLIISPTIEAETEKFRSEQDSVSQYIQQQIVCLDGYTGGKLRKGVTHEDVVTKYNELNIVITESISCENIAEGYIDWCKRLHNAPPKMSVTALKENFSSHKSLKNRLVYTEFDGHLYGYRIIDQKKKIPGEAYIV